jgi:glycosyltransferase involved in cell wall biosynthesis
VIPNGMDDILFKKIKNNQFRKQHGVKDKLVLFFGRLNPTKGPDKLAIVGNEITKERKDVCLLVRMRE